MLFDDVRAAVCGAAIHDDVFNMRIILRKHRLDRPFEESGLIERWRDDGDEGLMVGWLSGH